MTATAAQALSGGELYHRAAAASVEVLIAGRLEGSGCLADPSGLVMTASHVVWGDRGKVEVISPGIGRIEAKILAVDRGHDLALLQLPPRQPPYPSLPVAGGVPEPATEVYLFGAAKSRHELLLTGRVSRSAVAYEFRAEERCYSRVYYLAGTSPAGSSGGCWLDAQGRLVGVQSGFISVENNSVGVAYAAPPDAIAGLLRTRRSARTAELCTAVEELWEQPVEFIRKFPPGTEGVVTVAPGRRAAAAGLNTESVIIAADGRSIRLRDELLDHVRSKKPEDELTLRVLQPNEPAARAVKVTLACLEEPK